MALAGIGDMHGPGGKRAAPRSPRMIGSHEHRPHTFSNCCNGLRILVANVAATFSRMEVEYVVAAMLQIGRAEHAGTCSRVSKREKIKHLPRSVPRANENTPLCRMSVFRSMQLL